MRFSQNLNLGIKFWIRRSKISLYPRRCHNLRQNSTTQNLLESMRILLVTNQEECNKACTLLKSHCQEFSALGFDCEWNSKDGVRRPVALLQLASPHGLCCLFRLNILQSIPEELKMILNDSNILKLGVEALNDAKFLQYYDVQVKGTLDLRYLYPTGKGLADLVSIVLGIKLDKQRTLKVSDWEGLELTDVQKDYAAKDALVAIEMFKKWLLDNNKKEFSSDKIELQHFKTAYRNCQPHIATYFDIHFQPSLAAPIQIIQ